MWCVHMCSGSQCEYMCVVWMYVAHAYLFAHVWHVQVCLHVYCVHVCVWLYVFVCVLCGIYKYVWSVNVHRGVCLCKCVWYMHICDMCMYVYMYIPIHGRVDARGWCLPLPCPVYFLNMVCHWSWNPSFLLCWLASKSPGMPVSIAPVLGFWMDTTISWFFLLQMLEVCTRVLPLAQQDWYPLNRLPSSQGYTL